MAETQYAHLELTREEVDSWLGPAVLEFGTNWCGFCQGTQADFRAAIADFPNLHHVKIEDGPGRPLGRSYRVKLWPTFVFLKDGKEHSRLVRPQSADEILAELAAVSG